MENAFKETSNYAHSVEKMLTVGINDQIVNKISLARLLAAM